MLLSRLVRDQGAISWRCCHLKWTCDEKYDRHFSLLVARVGAPLWWLTVAVSRPDLFDSSDTPERFPPCFLVEFSFVSPSYGRRNDRRPSSPFPCAVKVQEVLLACWSSFYVSLLFASIPVTCAGRPIYRGKKAYFFGKLTILRPGFLPFVNEADACFVVESSRVPAGCYFFSCFLHE